MRTCPTEAAAGHRDPGPASSTLGSGSRQGRFADIDAPETGGAKCPEEAALGGRATTRLAEILSSAPFILQTVGSRDEDQYGRKLRIVILNGQSIGNILVNERLART
jgi:endonuclease YncB( thermonuclease family)